MGADPRWLELLKASGWHTAALTGASATLLSEYKATFPYYARILGHTGSGNAVMQTIKQVCVLGTHHAYQYKTVRKKYFENVSALIEIHSVDLVAEEASGIDRDTYAKKIADIRKVSWKNVDLTSEERKLVPDINALNLGTQIDFDLHSLREWVWVIRTAKSLRQSAMLICGFAHLMGVASKFHSLGFAVATEVYFDNEDEKLIVERTEPEPAADKITP